MPGTASAPAQTLLSMDNAKSIGEISLAHHLVAVPATVEETSLENAFSTSAYEHSRPLPPAAGGSWSKRYGTAPELAWLSLSDCQQHYPNPT